MTEPIGLNCYRIKLWAFSGLDTGLLLFPLLLLFALPQSVFAQEPVIFQKPVLFQEPVFAQESALVQEPIEVDSGENGDKRTGQHEIWHDPGNDKTLQQAELAYQNGEFKPLLSKGSTGLKPGAFWTHFKLTNTTGQRLRLYLEYVDHQLIELDAYGRPLSGDSNPTADMEYRHLISMSMNKPFDLRPISHNRFAFPIEIDAGQTAEYLVKLSSAEVGFIFPSLRIWTPKNLAASHTFETSAIAFLFGGILLMSMLALVGGIATGEKSFYAYALYCLSKIAAWGTILGYTHQYLIKENFHWSLMSISGAISILCGLIFSRYFLQTREFTPKLNYVLLFMMANAGLLLFAALTDIKILAIITITLALLLYPMLTVIGLVRWRQGSTEAGVFALAWSLLVVGLVVQAMRDLGLVAHNFVNYYWPPFASFSEMLTIMAAMGIKVRRLGQEKRLAEQRYRQHLERSKAELEETVQARTKELAQAKHQAELEARTDPLTGIHNRRSFLYLAGRSLKLAQRKSRPMSLLMFDIDHFKSINDAHGHSMGDEALCSFTRTILGSIRETDIFGRLGGEEFGLLVCEEQDKVMHIAERLRDDIARIELDSSEGTLQFTSSIGIAHMQDDCSIEELLKYADSALYEAKNKGRNTVIEFVTL